jgi:hypothetical protein
MKDFLEDLDRAPKQFILKAIFVAIMIGLCIGMLVSAILNGY